MSCSAYRFGRRPVRDRDAHGEQIAPLVTGETVTGSKGIAS